MAESGFSSEGKSEVEEEWENKEKEWNDLNNEKENIRERIRELEVENSEYTKKKDELETELSNKMQCIKLLLTKIRTGIIDRMLDPIHKKIQIHIEEVIAKVIDAFIL